MIGHPLTADDAARLLVAERIPATDIRDDMRMARALFDVLTRRGIRAGHAPTDFGAIRAAFGRRMAVAATFH